MSIIDDIKEKLPEELWPYIDQAADILENMADEQLVALIDNLLAGSSERRIALHYMKYANMSAAERAAARKEQNEAVADIGRAGALTQKQLLDIVKAMLLISLLLFKAKAGLAPAT